MANGWNKYEKLVLHELEEQGKKLDAVMLSVTGMKEDIAALKIKAAIAGGAAGVVGTSVVTGLIKMIWH